MNNKITFTFDRKGFSVNGTVDTAQLLEIAMWSIKEYIKAYQCKDCVISAMNDLIAKTEADTVMEVLFNEGDEDDEELD